MKNRMKIWLATTFLAGFFGITTLARAEKPAVPDLTIPGVPVEKVEPKGFLNLSGTGRLDNSDGGYGLGFGYKFKNNSGIEIMPLLAGFHESPDYTGYANKSGLSGKLGVGYKGLGLESGFGASSHERSFSKLEIKKEDLTEKRKSTAQSKKTEGQSTPVGIRYKKLALFEFANHLTNTDASTEITENYKEPGITVNSSVKEKENIKEKNSLFRASTLFDHDINRELKAEIGAELLLDNYRKNSTTSADITVVTNTGFSTDTTYVTTAEKTEDKSNENIAMLKGGLKTKDFYGYVQIANCFSGSSTGATRADGTFSGRLKKWLLSSVFGGDFYKGEGTKGSAGVGASYLFTKSGEAKNAFEEQTEITRNGYEISNSIVFSDKQEEILQNNLTSRRFASLKKGIGGVVNFIFNKGYKIGLEMLFGGAYRNFFGHVKAYVSDATKPGKFSSAEAEVGYKNWAVSYTYGNIIPLDINDLVGKDEKKHTVRLNLNLPY